MILDFKSYIFENIQQAEKYYFKTGKISEENKEKILGITNGDNQTKTICDMYYFMVSNYFYLQSIFKELSKLYNDLKTYNKNVFPITHFDNPKEIGYLIESLEKRRLILKVFDELPSIAKRNLKGDIRELRNSKQLKDYYNNITLLQAQISLISNRPEKIANTILKKVFQSNTTLNDILDFFEDKENLIKDYKLTKRKALEIAKENYLDIVYDKNNILILKVEDLDGIKAIGFMSLWCFTYGNSYRTQSQYSTNDIVYVIINYNKPYDSEYFMCVLIKPIFVLEDYEDYEDYDEDDEEYGTLFTILNEPINAERYIGSIMDLEEAQNIMNFDE